MMSSGVEWWSPPRGLLWALRPSHGSVLNDHRAVWPLRKAVHQGFSQRWARAQRARCICWVRGKTNRLLVVSRGLRVVMGWSSEYSSHNHSTLRQNGLYLLSPSVARVYSLLSGWFPEMCEDEVISTGELFSGTTYFYRITRKLPPLPSSFL